MVGDCIFIRFYLFIRLEHSSGCVAPSTCFAPAGCAIPRRTSDGKDAQDAQLDRAPAER